MSDTTIFKSHSPIGLVFSQQRLTVTSSMNVCRCRSAGATVAFGCRGSPELPLNSGNDRPSSRSGHLWSTPEIQNLSVVLGLGSFLVGVSTFAIVSVTVDYCDECRTLYRTEVSIIMNFYRLSFGTTTSYFVNSWLDDVGVE